jgi:predicted O-methyltransferase YrrM
MDAALAGLLDELYAQGREYDAAQADRLARLRNLEPETARLLALLVRATAARAVLELGTSNGYSTLWLADALGRTGGQLLSIDLDTHAQAEAATVLRQCGLDHLVVLGGGDGGQRLAGLPAGSVDLLFLDAERTEYPGWWQAICAVVRAGGLLIVDNAISHVDEVAPLRALLEADPDWTVCLLNVGKGELMGLRQMTRRPVQ